MTQSRNIFLERMVRFDRLFLYLSVLRVKLGSNEYGSDVKDLLLPCYLHPFFGLDGFLMPLATEPTPLH